MFFLLLLLLRPKGGVHPPAAGVDPQLPSGGAEVHVAVGGVGQEVSVALKPAEAPAALTWTHHKDSAPSAGWRGGSALSSLKHEEL